MIIVSNKKVKHDFFIEDNLEAGIVLHGWEVKSIRSHCVQIINSYIIIKAGELYIIGMDIKPLNYMNSLLINRSRNRKILLHKKEINRLIGKIKQKGLTLIPFDLHLNSNGCIKLHLVLCRGKKKYDKRYILKERSLKKDQEMY